MLIKSFKAPTLKEAMANVKAELGVDAVILHTSKTKKGGILGFHSKEVVEVIAAVEEESPKMPPDRPVLANDAVLQAAEAARNSRAAARAGRYEQQPLSERTEEEKPPISAALANFTPRTAVSQYRTAGTQEGVNQAMAQNTMGQSFSEVLASVNQAQELSEAVQAASGEPASQQKADYAPGDDDTAHAAGLSAPPENESTAVDNMGSDSGSTSAAGEETSDDEGREAPAAVIEAIEAKQEDNAAVPDNGAADAVSGPDISADAVSGPDISAEKENAPAAEGSEGGAGTGDSGDDIAAVADGNESEAGADGGSSGAGDNRADADNDNNKASGSDENRGSSENTGDSTVVPGAGANAADRGDNVHGADGSSSEANNTADSIAAGDAGSNAGNDGNDGNAGNDGNDGNAGNDACGNHAAGNDASAGGEGGNNAAAPVPCNDENDGSNGNAVPASAAGEGEAVREALEQNREKDEQINDLQNQLEEMKSMLVEMSKSKGKSDAVPTLQGAMQAQEVTEKILQDMIAKLNGTEILAPKNSFRAGDALERYLRKAVRVANGITLYSDKPKVAALIGPTGVGKTTTLAKIAARFVLEQGARVALITADTYRISAVEQLKTYSDILGLPLEIVYNPDALKRAIEKHKDKQLILIDTAGRSQYNDYQMKELGGLLGIDVDIEKHLVMSATTKTSDGIELLERFSICPPDRVIFSKVDETGTHGIILNILHRRKVALSYITNGQSVPDDIEPASIERLAELLLR